MLHPLQTIGWAGGLPTPPPRTSVGGQGMMCFPGGLVRVTELKAPEPAHKGAGDQQGALGARHLAATAGRVHRPRPRQSSWLYGSDPYTPRHPAAKCFLAAEGSELLLGRVSHC